MRATKLFAALFVFLTLSLAGCGRIEALRQPVGRASGMTPTAVTPVAATPTPSAAAAPATTPTDVATDVPTAAPATSTPKVAPSPTAAATSKAAQPSDTVIAAIKAVVERANNEQVDAFTKKDPTIMRDTATTSYYEQLQQTNRDLADNGVDTIKLVKIEWGPITLNGTTGASATTFETWDTSYVDGNSDESRDRNVYTLVLENGSWKIQDDAHPDSGLDTPPTDVQPAASPQPPQPLPDNLAPNASSSRNWSGYVASKGGPYTSVTGTWIVPKPSASLTTSAAATWVGIGGAKNRDLIQAGTEESVAGSNGVRYSAWIEMLPASSHTVPLKVNPGDSVTVTITQQSKDNWLITLKNNTTGKSYEAKENYQSSLSSAEWIEEAPSGGRRVYPLDNFGTVSFSDASAVVDGKSLSAAAAGARAVSMTDSNGRIIAAASKLGSDGKSFTVTRTDALPSANSKQFDGLFSFDPRNLLKADAGLGSAGAARIVSATSNGADFAQP
jgi:hypothetical protein